MSEEKLSLDMKDWKKYLLFNRDLQEIDRKVIEAVLQYILRRLSRGVIPNKNLVDTALKQNQIPECGYLGCNFNEEHVH